MNKRGFLLAEETLKVVIAVICIGFLVYFLTSLYFSNVSEQKLKDAESDIERISQVIDNSQMTIETISALKTFGWHLFGFTESKKPNSCANKNCLCICDEVNIDTFFGLIESRQLKECSDEGICLIVENLNAFEEIEIKKGGITNIEINKEDGVSITEK